MDSLSQIVLGAAVAEAVVGRQMGNRALLWGAIAGTIPDLDVISNWWLSEFAAMSSHRGFTHSLLFCLIASPMLGWVIHKIHRKRPVSWHKWTIMAFWCFITHIALDCCTTWGTMVFWPSDFRVTTNSIFVADPLYTVPFLLFIIVAMFFRRTSRTRRVLNYTGLVLSTFYLALGMVNKYRVNQVFSESLEALDEDIIRFDSRPAPLNIILWSVSAESETGIYLGFYSLLDDDQDIHYRFFPKNHEALGDFAESEDVAKIIHMSNDYYLVRPQSENHIQIFDLRFGLMSGWDENGIDDFVFTYDIRKTADGGFDVDVSDPPQPSGEEATAFLDVFYRRIMGDKQAAIDVAK